MKKPEQKMIVKFIKEDIYVEDSPRIVYNQKIGVLISTGKNQVSFSATHPLDFEWDQRGNHLLFDKKKAIGKALQKLSQGRDVMQEILETVKHRFPGFIQGDIEWENKAAEAFPLLYGYIYSELVYLMERSQKANW